MRTNEQPPNISNIQASAQLINSDISTNVRQSQPTKALLQVIPVLVSNGVKTVETVAANALLDCGSDSTLIRQDLFESLDLHGDPESIRISNVM